MTCSDNVQVSKFGVQDRYPYHEVLIRSKSYLIGYPPDWTGVVDSHGIFEEQHNACSGSGYLVFSLAFACIRNPSSTHYMNQKSAVFSLQENSNPDRRKNHLSTVTAWPFLAATRATSSSGNYQDIVDPKDELPSLFAPRGRLVDYVSVSAGSCLVR